MSLFCCFVLWSSPARLGETIHQKRRIGEKMGERRMGNREGKERMGNREGKERMGKRRMKNEDRKDQWERERVC